MNNNNKRGKQQVSSSIAVVFVVFLTTIVALLFRHAKKQNAVVVVEDNDEALLLLRREDHNDDDTLLPVPFLEGQEEENRLLQQQEDDDDGEAEQNTTTGSLVVSLEFVANNNDDEWRNDYEFGDNEDDPNFFFPILKKCQGDCDRHEDCQGQLECYFRSGGENVPGCFGGSNDQSNTDYCYDPNDDVDDSDDSTDTQPPERVPQPTPRPTRGWLRDRTPRPTKLPTPPLPTPIPTTKPPTPIPTTRNPTPIPTTQKPTKDPTISPTKEPTLLPTIREIPIQYKCNDYDGEDEIDDDCGFPLDRCEADCDEDSDCKGSLICWERDSTDDIDDDKNTNGSGRGQHVPGCYGGSMDESGLDYCIDPNDKPFRLKLYYNEDNENYCWQEICDNDPKLCAFYNYDRSYCYYDNIDDGDCHFDQLYIDHCGDDHGDDTFHFIPVGGNGDGVLGGGIISDRFLIQAAAPVVNQNTQQCLERSSDDKDIYLKECNPNNDNQRWYSPTLSSDHDDDDDGEGRSGPTTTTIKFEISIDGIRCMTTHHHPKTREVIELRECDEERRADTTYWERA